MGRALSGVNEPDEPNAELIIRMTVPEEFAGLSMGELNSRRGCIKGMDVQHGNVVIRGSVPTKEYDALADAISVATKRLGRIEREGSESI